ncbi:MAG: hypothetical protein QOF01_2808 [Thermomicrobiales bacterium]|nr:hypothetical protein [Thermomicrobiales bacterium]
MTHDRGWSRRLAVLGPLTVAGAMLLGIGAAAAHEGNTATPQAESGHPSIAVTGTGEASAPAEGAVIQIVVRRNDAGMANTGTPAVKAFAQGPAGGEPLTEAEVQPVVDALVAGGLPSDALEILIAPAGPITGPFGPGTAQILATVDQATLAKLGQIIPGAIDAALAANLGVDQAGVGYTVADCTMVETAALRDAVESGKAQAQQLAEILGVELGELTLASRQPSYNTYGGQAAGACANPQTVETIKEGALYLPPFNAALEPKFEVYVTVNLTYAIA